MRKLKLFFACLLMAVLSIGQMWATDFTLSSAAEVSQDGITVSFAKSSGSNAPAWYSAGLRLYASNTITITCDNNITGVTFDWEKQGNKAFASATADVGNYSHPTATGTGTWSGSAKTIVFTLGSSGQLQLNTFSVTIEEGGGSNPALSAAPAVIDFGTVDKGASVEPQDVTVTFENLTGSVTYSGLSGAFAASGTIAATGNKITITPNTANTGNFQQTLTVQSTADSKSAEVTVKMNVVEPFDGLELTFPDDGDEGANTSGYTVSWTATKNSHDWSIYGFNSNKWQNGWTYIKAGRKSASGNVAQPVTATIVTQVTGHAIGDIVVTVNAVTAAQITSHKLYVADNSSFDGAIEIDGDPATIAAGDITYTVPVANRANDLYYKLEYATAGTAGSNGTLTISKITYAYATATPQKPSAGLAFDAAQKLAKVGGTLTAPDLSTADGFDGTVTYASSDEAVVKVNASTGAITEIVAAGKAVITAHSDETENFKEGSASYTIFVAAQAGTEADPLTVASAKTLIDNGCTLGAHVTGTVAGKQFFNSGSYNVTVEEGFMFYYFYAGENNATFASDILLTGDVLVAYGQLMKYGSTYEINPSYMVSRVEYKEPKVDISNTEATAYTPAQAIALYDDVTSDLTKTVYVKGVVTSASYVSGLTEDKAVYNGTYNVYVKAEDDESENPTTFEFYRMFADGENATFENGDIQVGELIVAKGTLSKYNSTYEFAQGCQMVSKKSKATMTFDDLEMVVNDEEALAPKTITLATAEAVTYAIKEGSDDCITLANGVVTATAEGTATIVATVATVEAYIGTSVEFTVTVSAAAPVLTEYYEKVTETAGITDGTYLIVYENGNVAFNGGLETLDAESNTIAVAITNDNKIGVTEATAAATFFIDVTAGSIQAANGKYIGVSSNSNGLKTSDDAATYTHTFSIDADGNAVIAAAFEGSTMTLRYNLASNQARFRYYKDNGQQAIQLYKLANETVKANPELAWSGDVEITLGDDFTAPTLDNPHSVEGITYSSDNEALATVTNAGVISLKAGATGAAHITASFAGDDTYKAVNVACTITVNAAAPAPAGTDNVVILAVYNEKYYAMSTNNESNAFTAIAVEYDGTKVTVKSDVEKTAIQWTRTTNGDNTTFQDADSKFMKSADGASMSLDANVCNWLWDATGGYYKISGTSRTFFFQNTSGGIFKNYAVSNFDKTGYSNKAQVIVIDPENIVITAKVSAELAYDPAEVELTVGDDFTPAALTYAEGFDGLAAVTYESSNTDLATVEGGVVSLVADATGTATITATFAGNNNYLAGSASYTITVNAPAPVPTTTTYRKVTATEEITDGEYLIVYETTSVAFNGALETLDAEGNSVAVVINEGVIAGTTAIDAAVFTIDVTAGTLKSASGKYIGVSGNSNGLKQTEDASTYTHTFSIDGDGNAVIFANFESSTMKLRYNPSTNAGNLRFRYYKNDGQQAIQLYKKETVTPEPPVVDYTEVRDGLTAGWYYTMCLDKAVTAVQGGTIWKVVSKAANGNDVILEEVTGTLAAGRPYIFRAAASTLEVAYTGDAVGAPVNDEDNHGLVGSFTEEPLAQNSNHYIIYNNALYYVNSDNVKVGAHRAYLDMTGVPAYSNEPQQGNAPRRRVTMTVYNEQTTTGIDELNASDTPVKMIIDGQLFIIRGEKMFNANGQLVK